MEKFVLSGASAGVIGHDLADESTRPEVKYLSGFLWIEIIVREGSDSLFSVNDNSGKLKSGEKILNSGPRGVSMALKNGIYVSTLSSGRSWAARIITINLP